jgi:hypothetical protein
MVKSGDGLGLCVINPSKMASDLQKISLSANGQNLRLLDFKRAELLRIAWKV